MPPLARRSPNRSPCHRVASAAPFDPAAQPLALVLFTCKHLVQGLRQQAIEPVAHDPDDPRLRQRFRLDRFVQATITLEAAGRAW